MSSSQGSSTHLPVFVAGTRHWTVGDVRSFSGQSFNGLMLGGAPGASVNSVEDAIAEFRYRHDLISAEECEAWLALRGLEYTDLHDCISRRSSGVASRDDREAEIDFLLSDQFAAVVRALSWRVAMAVELQLPLPSTAPAPSACWREWEQRFDDQRGQLLSTEARTRVLARLRRSLTRVHFLSAEFDSINAALEARSCVNEDRTTLESVAAANGYPYWQDSCFIDELPAEWAPILCACALGAASSPLSLDGRFLLLSTLQRTEPRLTDADVLARIDSVIVEQHFDALASKHVRWIIPVGHG